jgi:hypothetical protein
VTLLSGCSIHPLPEDFAGVDTYHIVRQIRCETRESVKSAIIVFVRNLAENGNDPIARKLLAQYEGNPEAISQFHAR